VRILLAALILASAAALADEPPVPAAEQSVALAISRVYPALVQIFVLATDHSGGRERKQELSGSGIIISPDGYVVTNHHVAGKAASLRVTLSSREQLDAVLVGTDPFSDIAVIKLDLSKRTKGDGPLPSARFGPSTSLKVGDAVLAMGCPYALSHSVTQGIVANKDMMLPRSGGSMVLDGENVGALVKWIGHDAAIAPGNSGGPLVNLQGEVVGINEIGLGPVSGAIPSELARSVSEELIAHGKVRRAQIGAEFQPLLRRTLDDDPAAKGVLVADVEESSAAAAAGLRAGDVITSVDGAPVSARFREELPAFQVLLLGKPIGGPLKLGVRRGKERLSLSVKTELRAEAQGKETEVKEWGIAIAPLTKALATELRRPDAHGVLIAHLRPGGPSDRAVPPLQRGDLIVAVGGKPVSEMAEVLTQTKSITDGKQAPVSTLVAVERRNEQLVSVVEIGIRVPQQSPEEVHKAWLPVTTQVMTRKLATALGYKGKKGVRITQVFPGGSAQAAGLKVGDVITHVDTIAIEASEPHDEGLFDNLIRDHKLGTSIELTVLRGPEKLSLHAVLDEGPRPEGEMKIHEDAQLEFRARDASVFDRVRRRWKEGDTGVIVTQVEGGGWAAVGGLQLDDEIQAVDGAPTPKVDNLKVQLQSVQQRKAARVVMLVRRGARTLFIELEPKWR